MATRQKKATKPNPFDDIARQVIADQEAKDREAGRNDLFPVPAKPVDRAKSKRTTTKPARRTKVQANGNGVAFSGRPTTKAETVAARVKQLGLRVRADADVDAIAARLRATPDAVQAWLDGRIREQSAKATTARTKPATKATAKRSAKPKGDFLTGVTLQQEWTDKKPDWLHRHVLIVRYQVRDDGAVFRTLTQIRTPDGKILPNYKDYPLDFRPTQERDGRNRPVVLKGDLKGPALRDWLLKRGIASPQGGQRHPSVPTIGTSPRP
jgi:hypothetical protein